MHPDKLSIDDGYDYTNSPHWQKERDSSPRVQNQRRGRDSNPRGPFSPTPFPGEPIQPLSHLSASSSRSPSVAPAKEGSDSPPLHLWRGRPSPIGGDTPPLPPPA